MFEMATRGNDFNPNSDVTNVSRIKNLNELIKNYQNEKLIPYFEELQKTYPFYRAVSGDGNCFYRAIAFMYLREANLKSFESVFKNIQNCCQRYPLQFQGISFQEKLYQIYQQKLKHLQNTPSTDRQDVLANYFSKSLTFDTIMILYFRSLNYNYIQNNKEKFSDFIDSEQKVEQIRVFGNQSEGIEYEAMANALNIKISIKITDRHGLNTQTYNMDKSSKSFDLFFRPGHFDILYHKDSPYIKRVAFHQKEPYQNQKKRTQQILFEKSNPKTNYGYMNDKFIQSSPAHKRQKQQISSRKLGQSKINKDKQQNNQKRQISFSTIKPLRQKPQIQIQKIRPNLQQDEQKKKKPVKMVNQKDIPLQKILEYDSQGESQNWRKVKQVFLISVFLLTLGYAAYAF